MNDKKSKLESQIKLFLMVRGHTLQTVDCEQVMREMMEEINYLRMVAKHPGEVDRLRGGQKTAKMDRLRYQHMIGYLTGKHSINQAEAAEIISEHSMSVTGRSPKPKTILELASGWKKSHEFEKVAKKWGFVRWELHKDALFELMEMTGDPDYFPEQIANYRKPD